MSTVALDDLALETPCPACGAEPGYWCVTYRPTTHEPGRTAVWLHSSRTRPVRDAWHIGYLEGQRNGYGSAAQSLESAAHGHVWARDVPSSAGVDVIAWLRKQADVWGERL